MSELGKVTTEAAAIAVSSKTTTAGAATGVLGWLLSVNWIGWAGILIAVASLAVNVYFLRRRDRRETTESHARMAALKDRLGLEQTSGGA